MSGFKDILVLSDEFTWSMYGEKGEMIQQAIQTAHEHPIGLRHDCGPTNQLTALSSARSVWALLYCAVLCRTHAASPLHYAVYCNPNATR